MIGLVWFWVGEDWVLKFNIILLLLFEDLLSKLPTCFTCSKKIFPAQMTNAVVLGDFHYHFNCFKWCGCSFFQIFFRIDFSFSEMVVDWGVFLCVVFCFLV